MLQSEAVFHDLVKSLGFNKFGVTYYLKKCLFVERFDIEYRDGKEIRYGLESISSSLGDTQFGVEPGHWVILDCIKKYSTSKIEDVKEYILRDIFNLVLGNKDNHTRNTSWLKKSDETVRLSPWYDLCSMAFDSTGVSRVNRWESYESAGHVIDWHGVFNRIESQGYLSKEHTSLLLKRSLELLTSLKLELKNLRLEEEILDYISEKRQILEENLKNVEL